jgi:hypothetical protein
MFEVEVQRKGNTDDTDETDFHGCTGVTFEPYKALEAYKRSIQGSKSFEFWVLSFEVRDEPQRTQQAQKEKFKVSSSEF